MPALSLSLLLLIAVPTDAGAPATVLSQGQVISATDWSIGANGTVIVTAAGPNGSPKSIAVGAPALVDANRPRQIRPRRGQAPGAGAMIQLTNGEMLLGAVVEPDSPGTVRFTTRPFGAQRLALDKIATIHLAGRRLNQPATAKPADAPYLLLTNGDVVSGVIKAVTPEAVTIDSAFGQAETSLSRVASIAPATDPPSADGRAAGQLICSLADGQRWYVDTVAAGPGQDQLSIRRAGRTVELPVTELRQLVFAGWTVRELIALGPPEVETTAYLGETVRLQIDDPRRPRPRAIGGRSFVGGITARPRSRVTYTLDAPAAFLIGWVGVDPLRGSTGICDVRIESEGQTLVRFEGLTARAGARRIAAATTGLNRITLTTDFGPQAEIGDCVNWCELMLIEKNDQRVHGSRQTLREELQAKKITKDR